jgi:FtsZ-binding cell division protein ZapB
LNQFGKIEQRIAQLIEKCDRLEATNAELKSDNASLQSQLEAIRAAERQNEEIKTMVIAKIDGLMGKLDEFAVE